MPRLVMGGVWKATYTETACAFIFEENENPLLNNQNLIGVGRKYEDVFEFEPKVRQKILPLIKNALKATEYSAMDVEMEQGSMPYIKIFPRTKTISDHQVKELRKLLSSIVEENNKKHDLSQQSFFKPEPPHPDRRYEQAKRRKLNP